MSSKWNNKDWNKRQARICRVGPLISNTITPICQQNGFVQARILLEWEYIISPQFAHFCTPLKVTFPLKQRNNGRLYVKASSSMATEIVYQEPTILNKINQYFGYQAISSIMVLQGPITKKAPLKKLVEKPLSEAVQSSLKSHVQGVEDDRLRAALLSLGMGISQGKVNI